MLHRLYNCTDGIEIIGRFASVLIKIIHSSKPCFFIRQTLAVTVQKEIIQKIISKMII